MNAWDTPVERASSDLAIQEDGYLFALWRALVDGQKQAADALGRIEMELRRRMAESNATVIAVDGFKAELVLGAPTADPSVLIALKECEAIPPSELARGLSPAHDEVVHVPDKWDLRVVNTWKMFGDAVAAIIGRGIVRGPERLRIVTTPKKQA